MLSTQRYIEISGRRIGPGYPTYVVAEISANHHQQIENAIVLIKAAKDAGADAVKIQTYTADTMTIDCNAPDFQIKSGLWTGRTLYDLYQEAFTPWDWLPRLQDEADRMGIHIFSTPFDATAVDFLESHDAIAYKVASFEIVDIPLLKKIGSMGKPIIMSTGMASLAEMDEAVKAIRGVGNDQIALLHCTSAYPAPPEQMNIRSIPHLSEAFDVPVGLSDHTLANSVAVAAVSLGACIVEKHFIGARSEGGPDSAFSLEPAELRALTEDIRTVERALGTVRYDDVPSEESNRIFRRSLYVVADMAAGETFNSTNVRSIRPGFGLAPKHMDDVLGRKAAAPIPRGTALDWSLISS